MRVYVRALYWLAWHGMAPLAVHHCNALFQSLMEWPALWVFICAMFIIGLGLSWNSLYGCASLFGSLDPHGMASSDHQVAIASPCPVTYKQHSPAYHHQ